MRDEVQQGWRQMAMLVARQYGMAEEETNNACGEGVAPLAVIVVLVEVEWRWR